MLEELKYAWKEAIENELKAIAGTDDIPQLAIGQPPKSEMGDVAFPLFPYAKALKMAPQKIAEAVAERLGDDHPAGEIVLAGPYLNVRFDIPKLADAILSRAENEGSAYGHNESGKGRKVMIEFSSDLQQASSSWTYEE